MNSLKSLSLVAVALAAAISLQAASLSPALAYDPTSTAAVNVDQSKLALRGYDPVSYFTVGNPASGSAEYSAEYEGAVYHFATAENRDAFVADPAKYAPAYGGFCAMGAALNKKLDGDPTIWKIVNDRLYLNVSQDAFRVWNGDIQGNIAKADKNWPQIKDKAPQSLQ